MLLAQNCTPDPQYTGTGVYPDTTENLDTAFVGQPYAQLVTTVVPLDTLFDLGGGNVIDLWVDSAVMTQVLGLPQGFGYVCEPPSCGFPGGTSGCILIIGNPDTVDVGHYDLQVDVVGYVTPKQGGSQIGPFDFLKIDYYFIKIMLYPNAFNLDIVELGGLNCNDTCGGWLKANPSGGASPYNYQWSNGGTSQSVTGICAGMYILTVVDVNSDTAVSVFNLIQPITLSVDSFSVTNATTGNCDGIAVANVSGGTQPYNYQWDDQNQQTTATASGLCLGQYTVIIVDTNGCTNTATVTISEVAGMEKMKNQYGITVYPNPNNGVFQIKSKKAKGESIIVRVYNVLGKEIYQQYINSSTHQIDLSACAVGSYFMQIITPKGVYTEKIIISP